MSSDGCGCAPTRVADKAVATWSGRILLFDKIIYLPLLHTLVEERAGERRLFHKVPLSLALSPLGGARERQPTISKEFAIE
jgi:hypothetical protein